MLYSQSLVAGRELLALRSRSTTGDRLTDSSLIQSSSFSSSRRETLREDPRQGRKVRCYQRRWFWLDTKITCAPDEKWWYCAWLSSLQHSGNHFCFNPCLVFSPLLCIELFAREETSPAKTSKRRTALAGEQHHQLAPLPLHLLHLESKEDYSEVF